MIPELISRYVDTGKVRYVYREYPLPSHPNAQKASEAAICAGRQDKESFWEMNEKLYETVGVWGQSEDPSDVIKSYADELGLDEALFVQCLDEEEAAKTLELLREYSDSMVEL